jgi:hypothetical protein
MRCTVHGTPHCMQLQSPGVHAQPLSVTSAAWRLHLHRHPFRRGVACRTRDEKSFERSSSRRQPSINADRYEEIGSQDVYPGQECSVELANSNSNGDNGENGDNSSNGQTQGQGQTQARAWGRGNDTFQQLRQAVLSSLDFTDGGDAQLTDWEDSWDELGDEMQASASAVGKAVYETLRIDKAGKTRRVYVRRRDLIRSHGLQPRDLRRVDPSLSALGTKTSQTVAIRDGCVLINLGGIRAIISADRCLLFEPASPPSRKFIEAVTPRLAASAAAQARMRRAQFAQTTSGSLGMSTQLQTSEDSYTSGEEKYTQRVFPFELEILEAALMVATGKLEAELLVVTRRVGAVLQKLPREITPVNLEELRRVKQLLVELESKAENLRDLLEEMMDDEDEIRELNLSSRPKREEKRRQRERDRLEREMEREWAERGMRIVDGLPASDPVNLGGVQLGAQKFGNSASNSSGTVTWQTVAQSANEDNEGPADAQDALEEMMEEEEEERELEEVEELLEYYLQRAATTQSEAERLLAGARDLEESIGVSLSARRFEVNRLELLLSIASFAAALGAMVASIFGMNLRSTLEMSVIGFWGTTAMIIAGSMWVFWVLYKYTKSKRIL